MAHILRQLGAAALKPRTVDGKRLEPLISFEQAMQLREQFYANGQPWPYENVVPGPPKPPPGAKNYLKRQQENEARRAQRQKEIKDALAKMPQLIAEYKASRKLNWSEVTPLDKLTLSTTAIREKYVKRRLAKGT